MSRTEAAGGPRPQIAAIICTHNRAALLPLALDSLAAQTLARREYEVLVVDNASTDATARVARAWVAGQPHARYVYEPRLGLSQARNRGLAETRAPLVAYLDDDARAGPEWLQALSGAFESVPRPAAAGGPVHLLWQGGQPPAWMSHHLLHMLGYMDAGREPCLVPHVNGGNFALDSAAIAGYGGFKVALGRQGRRLLGSEESDLMHWLRARGQPIFYEPRAGVAHFIPRERQTLGYMLRACYGLGWSAALRNRQEYGWYRLARYMIEMPVRTGQAFRVSQPLGRTAGAVILLAELVKVAGYLRGQGFPT